MFNSSVTKINGKKKVESVDVINNKEEVSTIPVSGLFIAVGQEPKNQIFGNIIELNEFGYILSEDGVHTNVEGIYVAGDARVKELRQLVTATADGAIAATTAMKELKKDE